MQFYEKLSFIMNLTQTTNSKLARAIQVDPAVISRFRNGKRGIPRNQEPLRAMSAFFAQRCETEYQRIALVEKTGARQVMTAKDEQLSEFIFYWLCDDTDGVNRFMRNFESLTIEGFSSHTTLDPNKIIYKGNFIYYGNEGKRAAVRAIYQHILTQKEPSTICILADETDDWMMGDYDFISSIQSSLLACIKKGFSICQIIPPIYSGDQVLESLTRWIPLYMTGKVTPYFYPHIRDRLYRRSIIMVPEQIALFSHSLSGQHTSYTTMLTTDTRLLQATEQKFQDNLALCQPMLQIHSEPLKLFQCFMNFISPCGFRIQKLHTLSAITAPLGLINNSIDKRASPEIKQLGQLYLQEMKKIEKDFHQYDLIDIVHLASAEQVRRGIVPIASTCGSTSTLYYTPETYSLHLENIIQIMDTHKNYHFIPLDATNHNQSTLMVKNHKALLVHTSEPFTVFEISQPEIVSLYREYLLQLAARVGYAGINRSQIKSRLKELIRELRN